MPVITSTGTVAFTPVATGQRIFMYRPDMPIFQIQRYWINIQDTFFEFKVLEDVEEEGYPIINIGINDGTNGLSTATTLTFSPPDIDGGTQLVGTPVITSGTITAINITNSGSGYVYHPTCSVVDPLNTSSTATLFLRLLYVPDTTQPMFTTTTYVRGVITGTINKVKSIQVPSDQTLWFLEADIVNITNNKDPEYIGLNVTTVDYLNQTKFISTGTVSKNQKLWVMRGFSPVFHRTKNFRTQSVILNPSVQGQRTAYRVPPPILFFIHNQSFTSLKQLSWTLCMNAQDPTPYLDGPSASDFTNPSVLAAANTQTEWVSEYELIEDIWCVIPDGPITAGTTINVQVTTNPSFKRVYLESICGVLDRSEVVLKNGQGQFNILTSTLQAGEVVDVKVGFKYWTNVERIQITLS